MKTSYGGKMITKELLIDLYIDKDLKIAEVASELNSSLNKSGEVYIIKSSVCSFLNCIGQCLLQQYVCKWGF